MNWQDEQKKVATGVTGGQEPVAQCMVHGKCFGGKCIYPQPKREWVGLTDEEVEELWESTGDYGSFYLAVDDKLKELNECNL
jgi:hypothetical protein